MMSYAISDLLLIQFTYLYLLGVLHLVPSMIEAVLSLETIFLSVHTHYHSITEVTIIGREI